MEATLQTFPLHLHLNLWAILISALIQWILGSVWFSPALFSRQWMALLKIDTTQKPKGLVFGMVSSFIGDLVLSLVLEHWVLWSGASTFGAGVAIGVLTWVGFFVAPNFAQGIYEQRPFKLFAITNGYWMVALVITGGLLAVWR
jgi:hypothetical protein